jgi:cell division septation protein DedD
MPATDCATDTALPVLQSEDSSHPVPQRALDGALEEGAQDGARGEATSDGLGGAPRTLCASKPLRGLFFGFTVTVTIGLALASWYLGVRIVAADEVAPPSATQQAPPPVAPIGASPIASVTIASTPVAVAPPVNLYLQVAGLGPRQDADFVSALQAKGFQGEVQTGDDGSPRILIGPYSTHTEMEQAQRKLQSRGVLTVETAY